MEANPAGLVLAPAPRQHLETSALGSTRRPASFDKRADAGGSDVRPVKTAAGYVHANLNRIEEQVVCSEFDVVGV